MNEMTVKEKYACCAMLGLLAAENEECGIFPYREDPNTGKPTYSTHVYPLNPETKQEDYTKQKIPTKLIRTREQEIAFQSFEIAEAMLNESNRRHK